MEIPLNVGIRFQNQHEGQQLLEVKITLKSAGDLLPESLGSSFYGDEGSSSKSAPMPLAWEEGQVPVSPVPCAVHWPLHMVELIS